MSDNLNQQFNDFRLSQMDHFKGMNQFLPNPSGNDDLVSNANNLFNFDISKNPNNENADNYLNTMDYYNNIPDPSLDKSQKNFSDLDQMHYSQDDMMKMMEKLNLGQNNEGFFNPLPNNNSGLNQMRGGQLDDDENTLNLNQAFNQLSQNQNNQFGMNNMNLSDNLNNIMNQKNESQNKPKMNKNQNKKNRRKNRRKN